MNTEELSQALGSTPKEQQQGITKIIDLKTNNDMREVISNMNIMLSTINTKFDQVNSRIDHLEKEMLTLNQATNQRISYLVAAVSIGFAVASAWLTIAFKFFK